MSSCPKLHRLCLAFSHDYLSHRPESRSLSLAGREPVLLPTILPRLLSIWKSQPACWLCRRLWMEKPSCWLCHHRQPRRLTLTLLRAALILLVPWCCQPAYRSLSLAGSRLWTFGFVIEPVLHPTILTLLLLIRTSPPACWQCHRLWMEKLSCCSIFLIPWLFHPDLAGLLQNSEQNVAVHTLVSWQRLLRPWRELKQSNPR